MLSFLQVHSLLTIGLFHIRQLAPGDTKDIARNGLLEDGLIAIHEVCDPTKPKDDHDEARRYESHGTPVLPGGICRDHKTFR